MSKFFRIFRRKYIDEGKLTRYILYAIGEIFLIIIGILIALQLNNKNQTKQKIQKEIAYLKEIQENLKENLQNDIDPGISKISQSVKTFDSLYFILDNPLFIRDVDTVIPFLWDITNPVDIVLNTVGFDNLTSTGIDLISNDILKTSITKLYGYHFKHLMELDDAHHNFTRTIIWPTIQNNINFSRDNITDEELNFLRTNGPFYSRMFGNESDLKGILGYLKFLKPQIERLILDIDNELNRLYLKIK